MATTEPLFLEFERLEKEGGFLPCTLDCFGVMDKKFLA